MQLSVPRNGPQSLEGVPVYSCAMGTAVVFVAGLFTATYAGIGLQNPAAGGTYLTPVKLVPLKATWVNAGVGTANNFIGLAKIYGTNSAYGLSGAPGPVFAAGVSGTTTARKATVFGTFTMSNGTCTSAVIQWLAGGGATAGAPNAAQSSLDGEITVMPGETLVFVSGIAGTGVASITWAEVPL